MISNRVLFRLGINISRQLVTLMKGITIENEHYKVDKAYIDGMEWACKGCRDKEVLATLEVLKKNKADIEEKERKRNEQNLEYMKKMLKLIEVDK